MTRARAASWIVSYLALMLGVAVIAAFQFFVWPDEEMATGAGLAAVCVMAGRLAHDLVDRDPEMTSRALLWRIGVIQIAIAAAVVLAMIRLWRL